MFSALVQYFLFPQYSQKVGKLQHMCNRPISLFNTQACVISALHRSSWGSTQNHTLSALLHNQQCLFLLDLFLLSHHSSFLKHTLIARSSVSHFLFSFPQSHCHIGWCGMEGVGVGDCTYRQDLKTVADMELLENSECNSINRLLNIANSITLFPFTLPCNFVSIVHVTCQKGYTHRDNLSTNSDGLIPGKCQVFSICGGTHMETWVKKERGYSFLALTLLKKTWNLEKTPLNTWKCHHLTPLVLLTEHVNLQMNPHAAFLVALPWWEITFPPAVQACV